MTFPASIVSLAIKLSSSKSVKFRENNLFLNALNNENNELDFSLHHQQLILREKKKSIEILIMHKKKSELKTNFFYCI